jgi:glycosyltransferase involved in cell wall biosynthesis
MIASFVHDHYFVYSDKDKLYYDGSGGVFNYKLWDRYLSIFDKLIVVGRSANKLPNKLIVSSHLNVSFQLNGDLKNGLDRFIKFGRIKNKLEKNLLNIDFAIIRLPSSLGYIAIQICKKHNIPYVIEVVACPWDAYANYGSRLANLIAPVEYLRLRNATLSSKYVVYVTKHFLQKRYPTRGESVAISNAMIYSSIEEHIAKEFYEKQYEVFRIGMIGSFHVKFKGHIEAIKAVDILVKKGIENIELSLVGTGDSTWVVEIIKEFNLEKYIKVVGVLEAGEKGIYPYLDKLHLYIHPSLQEGLPRVVIEALSRGKLVLGSSVAGIPELIDESFLHKPGDYKELSKHIEKIINGESEWLKIINSNIRMSHQYHENVLQTKRVDFLNKII